MLNHLSKRETQIAEMVAWGATKQEIATAINRSYRTVDAHIRTIYEKTECNKSTELSAWWFCHRYDIDPHNSPLKKLIAMVLLMIIVPQMFIDNNNNFIRTRTRTESRVQEGRKGREDSKNLILI